MNFFLKLRSFTATNDPPIIEKNELTIIQGKRVFLTPNELSATDEESPLGELNFLVNNVKHGYFEDIDLPDTATTMFTQQQLIDGNQIRFVHDGSTEAPGYTVIVNDGSLSSAPSQANIHFVEKAVTEEEDMTLRDRIITGAASGVLGLIFLAIKIYINRKAAKSLKKLMEESETGTMKQQADFHRNVVYPVFKALYDRVNLKGFLGYADERMMKQYVDSVARIIEHLDEEGVSVNLEGMEPVDQARMVNAIVHEIKEQFVLNYSCCSCSNLTHFLSSFFVADITPDELEQHAKMIAINVRKALQHRKNTYTKEGKSVDQTATTLDGVKVEQNVSKEPQQESPPSKFGFFDQHKPSAPAIEMQPVAPAEKDSTHKRYSSMPF